MPDTDIGESIASDLQNKVVDYSVDAVSTDAPGDQEETTWQSTTWTKNLGYYKKIPELKSAIDTKVTWVIGSGFEADEETTMLLGTIKGNGKESFNSILANQYKVSIIDGDSYAEIITDDDDVLANLKPLAPDTIISVWNRQGRIKRYEQVVKKKWWKFWKSDNKIFKPEQIFHLSRDRIADEMHGISVIPAVEEIILMRNEAMTDWKAVLHQNIRPRWKIMLDTDDTAKIAAFKKKYDAANALGENMYIPKGTVEVDVLGVSPNATLNPLAWIENLTNYFYQLVNVPQIIVGNAKAFTDASGKIVYLAFEQSVKGGQLYNEEQVLAQLNSEIKLTFPASLQTDAVSDTPSETDVVEEEPIEDAAQANDKKEELEGKK